MGVLILFDRKEPRGSQIAETLTTHTVVRVSTHTQFERALRKKSDCVLVVNPAWDRPLGRALKGFSGKRHGSLLPVYTSKSKTKSPIAKEIVPFLVIRAKDPRFQQYFAPLVDGWLLSTWLHRTSVRPFPVVETHIGHHWLVALLGGWHQLRWVMVSSGFVEHDARYALESVMEYLGKFQLPQLIQRLKEVREMDCTAASNLPQRVLWNLAQAVPENQLNTVPITQ